MPKQKTKKAVAGRIKLTKTGKVKRGHQMTRHLLSSKSSKRRRRLRQQSILTGKIAANYRRLMGA
ncbi:MAG: 50S ribosomal protein L35 [Planctomycetes bacterium]|nr:50S ribosomal protein L35 [Planctomycetota bacterium]NQU48412.1 50S ribosomal protein L35 [Planctomycetota bacterium]